MVDYPSSIRDSFLVKNRPDAEIISVDITIGQETRTVEALVCTAGNLITGDEFVATIGRGSALYPTDMGLEPVTETTRIRRWTPVTTGSNGKQYTYGLHACIRNRQGQIVAFRATRPETNNHNQTRTGGK